MQHISSGRYVVLRHLKTSRMAEVCEYISGPLTLTKPDDVFIPPAGPLPSLGALDPNGFFVGMADGTTRFVDRRRTMEATLRFGGTIAHHHGIGRLRSAWMDAEHGEGIAVLRAIKRALDPNGIMNPGALLPPESGG